MGGRRAGAGREPQAKAPSTQAHTSWQARASCLPGCQLPQERARRRHRVAVRESSSKPGGGTRRMSESATSSAISPLSGWHSSSLSTSTPRRCTRGRGRGTVEGVESTERSSTAAREQQQQPAHVHARRRAGAGVMQGCRERREVRWRASRRRSRGLARFARMRAAPSQPRLCRHGVERVLASTRHQFNDRTARQQCKHPPLQTRGRTRAPRQSAPPRRPPSAPPPSRAAPASSCRSTLSAVWCVCVCVQR